MSMDIIFLPELGFRHALVWNVCLWYYLILVEWIFNHVYFLEVLKTACTIVHASYTSVTANLFLQSVCC